METKISIDIQPRDLKYCGACNYAKTLDKYCKLFGILDLDSKQMSLIRSNICILANKRYSVERKNYIRQGKDSI